MSEVDGKRNIFWIDSYSPPDCPEIKFPDRIISRSTGKEISIRDHREKPKGLLEKGNTKQLGDLTDYLRDAGIGYIREFIFPVYQESLGVFREHLKRFGFTIDKTEPKDVKKRKEKIWNINYFSADLYLPRYGCILELDSEYHQIPEYDSARDRMILEYYGVPTYRFFRYDINPERYNMELQGIFRRPQLSEPWYPDILRYVD